MTNLLKYMAIDVDELSRKTALSEDYVCCGSNELSQLRETTNFVNFDGKPNLRFTTEVVKPPTKVAKNRK